jgi:hypothetical protein
MKWNGSHKEHVSSRGVILFVAATVVVLLGSAFASYAGPLPLSDCPTEELTGSRYYLTEDLDCGGGSGLQFKRGGKLELRGFSIRNASRGVFCHRCRIVGPGTISDCFDGVEGYQIKLFDVTVSNSEGTAAKAQLKLFMENSRIENSGTGALAPKKIRLRDSQITGNRLDGIEGFGSSTEYGCPGAKVRLINSSVIGNNTGPVSGSECQDRGVTGCADIRTCNIAPQLDATSTCDASLSVSTGTTWGVCSLD